MEQEILAEAAALAAKEEYQDSPLLPDYKALAKNYKKLAKKLKLMIRLGDKQQLQLTDLNEQTLEAQSKQAEISARLSKYLSPQVYQSIFEGKNIGKLETTRKPLTVFFSDLQGFTQLTDKLEPETLTFIINSYLETMSGIALKHGGTIDKFIGDAIMIFFGDPESQGKKEDALRCVRMALEMRGEMPLLRQQWEKAGMHISLQVRMGINSGYCTVGNFGSENRMDYTLIGGHVNLASRLESQAAPDQILISEDTYIYIREEVDCEQMARLKVKGIAYEVQSYQVLDFHEKMKERLANELAQTRRKPLTVFFSDLQGFTGLTDKLDPQQFTFVLNSYFEAMSKIAVKYGGFVSKFMGDAILIFFGDPDSQGAREDTLNCIRMALEMRQHMEILHEEWAKESGFHVPLTVGMGINSGYCAVGNFGSKDKRESTIIGTQVSLAGRLSDEAGSDQILISEETQILIQEHVSCKQTDFLVRDKCVYEVLGIYGEMFAETQQADGGQGPQRLDLSVDFKQISKNPEEMEGLIALLSQTLSSLNHLKK